MDRRAARGQLGVEHFQIDALNRRILGADSRARKRHAAHDGQRKIEPREHRKRHEPDGTWKTIRIRENCVLAAYPDLVAVARTNAHFALPRMIIETSYQLGTLGDVPATLVLWRTPEEGSAPIGGALALPDPPPALLDALSAVQPPFDAQAEWTAEFDALSP